MAIYAYELARAGPRRSIDLTEYAARIERGLRRHWGGRLVAVEVHERYFLFELRGHVEITASEGGQMGRRLMRELFPDLLPAARVSTYRRASGEPAVSRQLFKRMRRVPELV